MKKKLFVIILSVITALCALSFIACALEFKINFVVDNEIYATVSTSGAETIKMPTNPTKEDYIFDGWFWDNGNWEKPFTANSLLDTPLSSDMNVYAKFRSKEEPAPTENGIIFNTLKVQGNEVYGKVSNETTAFNFLNEVRTTGKAKYAVSFNRSGGDEIVSKNVDLEEGDNVFYIRVTVNGEVENFYTVTIHRCAIFTVSFNTYGGTKVDSQRIEEGGFVIEPDVIPVRAGYKFTSWDYDFTKEIISNTTINAVYELSLQRINYDGVPDENGQYILFGEYPQTIKADDVIITDTTDMRGYYLGSDGYYYAKVTANPYKNNYYTFSNGKKIVSGIVCYFKVEPIKWRIIEEDSKSLTLLCEMIIDAAIYDSNSNNYAESEIREWLNNDFYNTAFNDLQKEIINTVLIDNGIRSTNPDNNAAQWNYGYNGYACENTEDKVWLLSEQEATKAIYGFNESQDSYDVARMKTTTDFTRASYVYTYVGTGYDGFGFWWLRSPYYSGKYKAFGIRYDGYTNNDGTIYATGWGIAPVIKISFE